MDDIEIMIEEYKSLRAEILNSMNSGKDYINIGIVVISAIFLSGILSNANLHESQFLTPVIFVTYALGVPVFCIIFFILWFGEYKRKHRAGGYLLELERKINALSGGQVLFWENHLVEQNQHMESPYKATGLLFVLISFFAPIPTVCILLKTYHYYVFIYLFLSVIYHIFIYFKLRSEINNIKRYYLNKELPFFTLFKIIPTK